MKELIKICGLSTVAAVDAARDNGATHLGFIFFEKSPRHVSANQAAKLAVAKGSALSVAVTVNASNEYLDEITALMQPDLLQLHGGETVERVAEIKARYGLPIIKAFAVRDETDLIRAKTYETVADMLLMDAKPPKGSDLPGGNGVSFDWSLITELKSETPILLSGGLDVDNVCEAMGHVRNTNNAIIGLDVSSGVESHPGVKDISKIERFLAACK